MSASDSFTAAEKKVFAKLTTPWKIQAFLDATPYSTDEWYRSPRRVISDGVAHCVDGALMACAALRRIGFPPLMIDLEAVRDDEHVVAVYRVNGFWGAVAKSNCTGLRYREPIHRTLRELVMTYFDVYFNTLGERTLRGYGLPVDLSTLDHLHWETREEGLKEVIDRVDKARHFRLMSDEQVAALNPMDERSVKAGFMGANEAGLFQAQNLDKK